MVFSALKIGRAQVLDLTFDPSANADVYAVAVQADGKILVAGAFTRIAGATSRSYLARLNPSGSLDTSFNAQLSGTATAIALLPGGKVLVGGGFLTVGGVARGRLARLNADGALDQSFNAEVGSGNVRALVVQPDGKIVLGGSFASVGGLARGGLARVGANGALDTDFSADVAGFSTVSATMVISLARQSDGGLLVAGQFGSIKGQARAGLARVGASGELDMTFNALLATSASVSSVAVQSSGRILVGGSFTSIAGQSRSYLARLFPDGTLDPSFTPAPNAVVFSLAEQSDGRILVGGQFSAVGGAQRNYFARLMGDGAIDSSFSFNVSGTLVGSGFTVKAILPTADGRTLVAGDFGSVGGLGRNGLARLVPPEPAITAQPTNVTGALNGTATLSVTVVGASPTYQWRKSGVPIPGATNATLTITGLRLTDSSSYDVVASNSFGSVISNAAALTILLPPAFTLHPISGNVITGQPAIFVAEASGSPTPTLQWQKDGVNIAGATGSSYAITAVKPTDGGRYTCVATSAGGTATSAEAILTVLPRARLANVSVRTTLEAAQSVIVGFVVSGGTANVMLRAAGPALTGFGITNAMGDPRIELFRDSTKLLENDNWPSVLSASFAGVAAFPFAVGSRDAALQQTLSGGHSAVVSGPGPGVVLVEAYDLGIGDGPRLVNLSARNRVGTDDDVLIAGFSVGGYGVMRVIVRAVGPTLGGVPFNVPGTLADPKLEIRNASGQVVAENDNWDPALAASFASVGAFGLAPASKDAALTVSLAGGSSYTAVVKGGDGGTGVALVEIYELP